MSDSIISSLNSALAQPNSLEQERKGRDFFLDEYTSAQPSEANMLTLLTMRDLAGKNSTQAEYITKIATEESKYLMHAMKFLSGTPQPDEPVKARLQAKFGKDFRGASELAKLLKKEAIEKEYKEEINNFLGSFDRKDPTALATPRQAPVRLDENGQPM